MEAYCFQAYADALEVIPTTLAENAGLNPIAIVTELRNRHALGEKNAGINVRKVRLTLLSDYKFTDYFISGSYFQHSGRRRRSAAACFDQRDRALHRDRLSVAQDRRLRPSTIEIDTMYNIRR